MAASSEKDIVWRTLLTTLAAHSSTIVAKEVIRDACSRCALEPQRLVADDLPRLRPHMEKAIRLFLRGDSVERCLQDLAGLGNTLSTSSSHLPREVKVAIRNEDDILEARGMARALCAALGFSLTDQTKIATVVSELSRNIVSYAGTGTIFIKVLLAPRPGIEIVSEDNGPGIADLEAILAGRRKSRTGMGLGLPGSRNLMDEFAVDTRAGEGTRVVGRKYRG
jgi:serine/threonine-protein kinase RsbT